MFTLVENILHYIFIVQMISVCVFGWFSEHPVLC